MIGVTSRSIGVQACCTSHYPSAGSMKIYWVLMIVR